MKLYTEEQVREAIRIAENCNHMEVSVVNGIMSKLTPIELPSDEEIEEISKTKSRIIYNEETNFQLGAKWMRDKIQGGNK